ncbi:MAG: NifU family protein [Nocardiaceae bacterium]|nr:NifU family protein [Nocardiaceae bacterium]
MPGEVGTNDDHWRSAGERIQNLLDAMSAGGPAVRERAEMLVHEVADLYGSALSRVAESLPAPMLDRLAGDELVSSLLLVHGLHPHDLSQRVSAALERVRPYLGSHGGDVKLLSVEGNVVKLQFAGSCQSCPSSSVTLEFAVEDAIRAAAPEIDAIVVVESEPTAKLIPAASLFSKVHADGTSWHHVPEIASLTAGEVGGFAVNGATVLACRVGDELYAYRDRCPACLSSMAGAVLHRGTSTAPAVLRCPRCRSHFDVVHAGASLDDDTHLDPLPLLVRDGVLSVAIPAGVSG